MHTYANRKNAQPAGERLTQKDISAGEMLHASRAGAPQPMSPALREKFEPGFNADFSNIRISRGHIPDAMGVEAVAKGTDILIDSRAGMDVLGHELAHVVQQAQGRVQGGSPVVHDAGLEHQADIQGARAASGLSADMGGDMMSIAPMSSAAAPAQCKSKEEKEAEKRRKEEREILTTSGANTKDTKKVNWAADMREGITAQKTSEDLASLTDEQKERAQHLVDREKEDTRERGASYNAALKRYTDSGKKFDPKTAHHERYLRRHLHGLDDAAQDAMFNAFAENDVDSMAGYLRSDFDQYKQQHNGNVSVYDDSDSILNNFDQSRTLSQNTMTPSDLVKDGVVPLEKLGMSEKEFASMKEEMQIDATRNALARRRINAMSKGDVKVHTPQPQPTPTIGPQPGQQYVRPQDLPQSGPGWEHTGSKKVYRRMGLFDNPELDTPTEDLMPSLRPELSQQQPVAPAKKKKSWWPFGKK